MSKSGEQWQTEVKEISELKELPEVMNFFYSKWSVISDVLMFSILTGALLTLNTGFLWAPQKHPNDFLAGILLGLVFLPFTIFFGVKTKNSISILISIGRPAITLSKKGYQRGDLAFPWPSIEKLTTTSYRTAFLTILHKQGIDGKKERTVVNLSLLKERHLPEYMETYLSVFGDSTEK